MISVRAYVISEGVIPLGTHQCTPLFKFPSKATMVSANWNLQVFESVSSCKYSLIHYRFCFQVAN